MSPIHKRSLVSLFAAAGCAFGCGAGSSDDGGGTAKVNGKRAAINAIAGLGSDLFNTNWVGKPCGDANKDTACPNGGQVKITGSYSCPTTNGVQTTNMDFAYELTDCVEVFSSLTLSLNGKMTHTGSSSNIGSTVTAETLSFKSVGKVALVGTGDAYEPIDESCDFALTSRLTEAGGDARVTGTLCGESFSLLPEN